jgi:hypothetical protein
LKSIFLRQANLRGRMMLRVTGLALIAAVLTACGGGKLTVEQPLRSYSRPFSVLLEYKPADQVPKAVSDYLEAKMDQAFFKGNPPFGRGFDITVRYRFVAYEPGSRVGRAVLGPLGVGAAQMAIEAEFVDQDGTVLSRVRSQGETRAGVFGGTIHSAIDRAVEDIRRYAVIHFKGEVPRK